EQGRYGIQCRFNTLTLAVEADHQRVAFAEDAADRAAVGAARPVFDKYADAIFPGREHGGTQVERAIGLFEDRARAGLSIRRVRSPHVRLAHPRWQPELPQAPRVRANWPNVPRDSRRARPRKIHRRVLG